MSMVGYTEDINRPGIDPRRRCVPMSTKHRRVFWLPALVFARPVLLFRYAVNQFKVHRHTRNRIDQITTVRYKILRALLPSDRAQKASACFSAY